MIFVITSLLCCLFTLPAFSYDDEAKEEIFLSTPEQVATLYTEPQRLIGGVISPLSGSPSLRQTDLVVRGAQEIALSRVYIAPYMPVQLAHEKHSRDQWEKHHLCQHLAHNYKGWQFYPHLKLQFTPSTKEALVTEPSGSTLCYAFTNSALTKAILKAPLYGISNCVSETPSGANDPRNTRIAFDASKKCITVHGTDAGRRIYRFSEWDTNDTQLYLLEKEILPNGKIIKYHYEKAQPTYVESLDPKERFVYASIRIKGSPRYSHVHFLSSSGQTTDYTYNRRSIDVKIKKKKLKGGYTFLCPPVLTSSSSPIFRHESLNYCDKFLLGSYSGKNDVFKVVNKGFGEGVQHLRVHKLLLPVGQGDSFQPVYELSYHPPIAGEKGGSTTVKNSDGTSIIYHFSKNLLTTAIQYLGKGGALKKEKLFSWSDTHWLTSVTLRDGKKNLLYKKSFEYDRFGNPILETCSGDLTGSGEITSTWIKRTFSDDGKNLLLTEESESGKVTSFAYLKGTNLTTTKCVQDGNTIIQREFWKYDDCHNLIEKITDDGSSLNANDLAGVTERRKTSYTLRQSAPFLHMPEWVVETYFDNGTEKLLKKHHLTYDTCGNIAKETVYDSGGNLAYTIEKTYNERGNLLSETNRLGQKATYAYDAKGRKTSETNFSGRVRKTYHYDARGRISQAIEEGDDGTCHTTSAQYDFHDRLIEKSDLFGNTTRYTYDPVANKVSQTDFPKIAGFQDVKSSSTYDSFGREMTYTDANGNTTSYSYTLYGSQSEIHHPGGGKERFRYGKTGDLISHTDPDGLTIACQNDALGRPLNKTYTSKEGTLLAEQHYTYTGFHLTSKTDKEGNLTRYSYDGAGRKVGEEFCGRTTTFSYDPLGRLATVHRYNGEDALVTHYTRDAEDQILSEEKTDLSGRLLYKAAFSYDGDGNQASTTHFINGQESVELFTYDPFRRKIAYRDALGYETHTSYNEAYVNDLGQNVLQIETTDPKGTLTIQTQDAHNRKVSIEKQAPREHTISSSEMAYDPHGNLTVHKDHIYEEDALLSSQSVCYSYTADHEVKSILRGYEPRETKYAYSKGGKLLKKTLPDGIDLLYSYHPLGFLARIDSSDGEIAHTFTYNKQGALLTAADEIHGCKIEREVDPFGNVISEKFPHGIDILKTYDAFNRPLSLTIVGHGEVRYTYDPMHVRAIERVSTYGDVLYRHTFDKYDLYGHLTEETLIGNLETVTHTIDPRGQRIETASAYFPQSYRFDSIQNLISSATDNQDSHYQYDATSQLVQEKTPHTTNTYTNDSLYNRTQKNGTSYTVNELNELLSNGETTYEYDLRGNQILKETSAEQLQMVYDPLNQLIEAKSDTQKVAFSYDPLGRRLAKTVTQKGWHGFEVSTQEHYLYDGSEEIGSFLSPNALDSFRILTPNPLPRTIAVELSRKPFASLTDTQGNIRRLIDIQSKAIAAGYDFSAFGETLQTSGSKLYNPWQFASKRLDPHLGLIYFGKRYYDPKIGRWITTDPAGFVDSFNLYQYVLNNPFAYVDPNGEFVFAIPLVAWGAGVATTGLTTLGTYLAIGAGAGVLAYGGYKVVQALNAKVDDYSPEEDYAAHVKQFNAEFEEEQWKKYNTDFFDEEPSSRVEKKGQSQSTPQENKEYKKPKPGISGKEGAKNIPSWAEGERPYKDESGKDFAKRLLEEKYGQKNHDTGPTSDFNKLKKYGDRSFE